MYTLRHHIAGFVCNTKLMVRAGITEAATLGWYESQLRHLEPLGDFPADALRTHHLAAIDFTNAFVRALKRLYKWAAEEDLVPKDPFAKLTIPPCGKRERVLTRGELAKLYLVSYRAFRRLLFCQIHTIARPGEIRNLTWGQIDWANRVIVLEKFKGKAKRRDKLRARAIPLDWKVLRMLRNLFRKSPDQTPTGRVFRSPRYNEPWTANGVRCAMRVARKRAGLNGGGERVVCYTLRHTGATNAIREGVELKHVAEVMGHARTSTTERYVHLNTADVVSAIDRASARSRSRTRPASTSPATAV
jgi:integrase